jgi:hypothetical protein
MRTWRYILTGLTSSVAMLYVLVWLSALTTITSFFSLPISLGEKLSFLFGIILSLGSNFTIFSIVTTVLLALAFGVYISLLIFTLRHHRTTGMKLVFGKGLAGFIAGIFGIGCSACGALFLGPILAAIGAGGALALLPFGGQGFNIVALLFMGYAIWGLVRSLRMPVVCDIE